MFSLVCVVPYAFHLIKFELGVFRFFFFRALLEGQRSGSSPVYNYIIDYIWPSDGEGR